MDLLLPSLPKIQQCAIQKSKVELLTKKNVPNYALPIFLSFQACTDHKSNQENLPQ
jgi:hypothetical protein